VAILKNKGITTLSVSRSMCSVKPLKDKSQFNWETWKNASSFSEKIAGQHQEIYSKPIGSNWPFPGNWYMNYRHYQHDQWNGPNQAPGAKLWQDLQYFIIWYFIGYNVYYQWSHLVSYKMPDPSLWTDEELGIPPDDYDDYNTGESNAYEVPKLEDYTFWTKENQGRDYFEHNAKTGKQFPGVYNQRI